MTITQYAEFSAVAFLKRYLRCLQTEEKQGLLFKLPDTPHSRRKITQFCQAVFEMPDHKRGFSFRGGGATDIFNLSHDETLVRHLGRWKSEAYLRYCRVSSTHLAARAAPIFARAGEQANKSRYNSHTPY